MMRVGEEIAQKKEKIVPGRESDNKKDDKESYTGTSMKPIIKK